MMDADGRYRSTGQLAERLSSQKGFYVWDVDRDLVFGDANAARLFGLNPSQAERGLPVATYVAAIHADDRERMRRIILEGRPGSFYHEYKIVQPTGAAVMVKTAGYRFWNGDVPIQHVGLVDLIQIPAPAPTENLVDRCFAAYEAAEAADKGMVQHLLAMALLELGLDLMKPD